MSRMKKPHYGWFIVIACLLVMCLAYAPVVSCGSLFIKPITEDLGFERGAYTLTSTISSLIGIAALPFVGKLMDTKKMHLTMVISIAGVAGCYAGYALCNTLPQFYLVSVLLGIFAIGAAMFPINLLITNWFKSKRAFVMSLVMMGASIGSTILSPIVGRIIQERGWRSAYIFLGVLMFVVLVPLTSFIIRRAPADKGLEPYGAGQAVAAGKQAIKGWEVSLKEAKGTPILWVFIFGAFAMYLTSTVLAHIPAAIVDAGYAQTTAANIASLYFAVAIVGKLLLGAVLDKFGRKAGLLFGNTCFVLSVVCLLFLRFVPMLYAMAILFGIGTCICQVTYPILGSSVFGTKHYSEIFGFATMFTRIGGAFGSPIIGTIYDKTGSYAMAWVLMAVLGVLMTVAMLYCLWASRKRAEQASVQTAAQTA